jgi:hypothetical protein
LDEIRSYSDGGGDFGIDFEFSPPEPQPDKHQDGEVFGLNVSIRADEGRMYRTYFTNWRGVEAIGTVWSILDRTPLGPQEEWGDTGRSSRGTRDSDSRGQCAVSTRRCPRAWAGTCSVPRAIAARPLSRSSFAGCHPTRPASSERCDQRSTSSAGGPANQPDTTVEGNHDASLCCRGERRAWQPARSRADQRRSRGARDPQFARDLRASAAARGKARLGRPARCARGGQRRGSTASRRRSSTWTLPNRLFANH